MYSSSLYWDTYKSLNSLSVSPFIQFLFYHIPRSSLFLVTKRPTSIICSSVLHHHIVYSRYLFLFCPLPFSLMIILPPPPQRLNLTQRPPWSGSSVVNSSLALFTRYGYSLLSRFLVSTDGRGLGFVINTSEWSGQMFFYPVWPSPSILCPQ